MEWWKIVEIVKPHVVQISTPRGSGSGFLISRSNATPIRAIATAAHVVNDASWWEEPIRLFHPSSGKTHIIRHPDRAIMFKHEIDTAAIFYEGDDLLLPDSPLALLPEGKYLKVGNEVGWLGFPTVSQFNMCFFSGLVSAWIQSQQTYLVDGVAINGVSGGPTFGIVDGNINLIGVMSAYIPNRATGEVLPGLSMVRDIAQFHEVAKEVKTRDDAAKNQNSSPPTPPPASSESTRAIK